MLSSPGRTLTRVIVAQVATPASVDIAAAQAGVRIFVVRIVLGFAANGTVKFTEGTGPTDLTGAINVAANGQLVLHSGGAAEPVLWTLTKNAKLSLVTTGAGNGANGYIDYYYDGS